jgi:hypothetical protein
MCSWSLLIRQRKVEKVGVILKRAVGFVWFGAKQLKSMAWRAMVVQPTTGENEKDHCDRSGFFACLALFTPKILRRSSAEQSQSIAALLRHQHISAFSCLH